MRIHFIGCCGVSMRVLCRLATENGHLVSGSDIASGGHNKKNIEGCSLVVFSGAIGMDNEELLYARKCGIPTMERSEFLAFIASKYDKTLAVAGCHGKTTTTAMLSEVFSSRKPTVHVGGDYGGKTVGKHGYFITEACEYRRSFLALKPHIGVITNIDFDHPDTYRDIDDTVSAFRTFAGRCGEVVYNGDDKNCLVALEGRGVSYGLGSDNQFVARRWGDRRENRFDVYYRDYYMGEYSVPCAGEHNVYNALAAITAGFIEGLSYREIRDGLLAFRGVKRRGEVIGSRNGSVIISDYAHHPTEIAAQLKTLKELYGTVAVIFQPHTYSRSLAMPEKFAEAFLLADFLAITNTFASRESGGDDTFLYEKVKSGRQCEFVQSDNVNALIGSLAGKYGCVALMGAGDFQLKVSV